MNVNHIGRAILILIDIWLVLVKIYGNNPIKLFNKINIKILTKTKVLPCDLLLEIKIFISLWIKFISFIHNILNREGINQYKYGMKKKIMKILIQLKEK